MSIVTANRSTRGWRLHNPLDSSCGSIGSTLPGRYTEHPRHAASRSIAVPAGTKAETSAMCTSTRSPPASRWTVIASSKSRASGGSIVNVSRSRRSTRPAPATSGSRGRHDSSSSISCPHPKPKPSSTVTARRTAATSSGDPSTEITVARPFARGRTATRSPSPAATEPLRPSVSGRPGSKNGSPISSRPRRFTSHTASGALSSSVNPRPAPAARPSARHRPGWPVGRTQTHPASHRAG